jgi:hypothetical protein
MKKLKNQMQTLKIITLCSGYDSQCLNDHKQ